MANTCPSCAGVTCCFYESNDTGKTYKQGATIPTISEYDCLNLSHSTSSEEWYGAYEYMTFLISGSSTEYFGWLTTGRIYQNYGAKETPQAFVAKINGKNLMSIGNAFENCTWLETAPSIPSTVINAYKAFKGCSLLEAAPTLPAGLLCAKYMFADCTSLESAPELPPLLNSIDYMFQGCTSLAGKITVNSNPSIYTDWLDGTVEPIKLVGASTMLETLASGYSNVSLLVAPSVVLSAERVSDESTDVTVTVNITGDPNDTTYSVVVKKDGVSALTWSNVTVESDGTKTLTGIVSNVSTDASSVIKVEIQDNWDQSAEHSVVVPTAYYTIDFLAGGHGVGFGEPCTQAGFYIGMDPVVIDTNTCTITFDDENETITVTGTGTDADTVNAIKNAFSYSDACEILGHSIS